MNVLTALLALFAISQAANLACFSTQSTDKGYKPLYKDQTTCKQNTTMCVKQTADKAAGNLPGKGVFYYCDYYNFCNGIKAGKCKKDNGVNTCCCSENLCNTAGYTTFFSAITVFPFVKLFV